MERLSRLVGAVALLGALLVWSTAVPALAQSASFTITARIDSGENGEIVPSGAVSVPAGGSQTFVLTASPGYKVAFVQVDGKSQGAISSFTFTGVSSNHTISAGFSPMTYTITVTSGPDGVVTPSSAVLFQHGDNQTYTIVPNPGYKIDRVVVDQTPQGPIDSYTFTSIRNDHTIVVSFTSLNGGAGSTTTPPPAGPGITDMTGLISGDGVFISNVTAVSGDGMVSVMINKGTTVLPGIGQTFNQIVIAAAPQLPPPSDVSLVGQVYAIKPDAATFDLPTTVQISFDPALVPAGVTESELGIATLEQRTGVWTLAGGSLVDTSRHLVSVQLGRFSPCAVIAPRRAAAFTVTDLEISPGDLHPGDSATVSVTVANTGGSDGTINVVLKIDGAVNATKDVTLVAGTSGRVEFPVRAAAAGSFGVNVGDLSGTMTVAQAAATPSQPSPVNWFLVAIGASVIGVVALVGVLVLLLLRRNPRIKPRPAVFTVRDLEISPRELRLGGKATVAATVANRGGHAGTFKVTLQIDGLTSSAKDVTLAGGTSDRVEFSVAATAAGSFPVKVAGLTSTLTILEAPPPVAPQAKRSEFAAGLS